jgi:competence ComEA-like helix-hairpin-helix protein
MFNLEKYEKLLILFLVLTLGLGVVVSFYKKSRPVSDIRLSGFPSGSGLPSAQSLESPKININEASADELAKLKGIGRTLAGRIIDYRLAHGPFGFPEEIMKVRGLGKALFEKIKDNISVE